jgi:hypothetical protein
MAAVEVSCQFSPGLRRLQLPELTGFDEQLVADTHTGTAIRLIDRLLVQVDSAAPKASALTASDRDRLLAAVYERSFGPRIQSTTRCAGCDQLFDLEFSIEQLRGVLDAPPPDDISQHDGIFRTRSGVRFRLPTGEDEMAASAAAPDQAVRVLTERCILDAAADVSIDAIEDMIEAVAPVLDIDLNAVCPECGHEQTVHFDMQFYLLRAIEQNRAQVTRDAHLLATTYRWSYQEILGLPRSVRQAFVRLIEADRSSQNRAFA